MLRSALPFASLLLLSVAACSSSSDSVGAGSADVVTSNSPRIVMEGADMAFAADLFKALKAQPTEATRDGVRVETKEVAGLTCERTTTGDQVAHRCVLKAKLPQPQLQQIYEAIDVATIDEFSGESKAVGPLVLHDDVDGITVKESKGCANVPQGDQAAADKCALFWADEIWNSFEGPNSVGVAPAAKLTSQLAALEKVMLRDGQRFDPELFKAPGTLVGVLLQESDDGDLTYFTLTPGRYAAPRTFSSMNIADISNSLGDDGSPEAAVKAWSLELPGVESALGFRLLDK